MCSQCVEASLECAFSEGFHRPDDEAPTVDPSWDGDSGDIVWKGIEGGDDD